MSSPTSPKDNDDKNTIFSNELIIHQKSLAAFLKSILPICVDPLDVLQEVNITLWKKKDDYVPGTNFRAWSFKVARLHTLKHLRMLKRCREVRFDHDFFDNLPIERSHCEKAESAKWKARREALKSCLENLPPEYRELIEIRYRQKLSIEEFAALTGRNPGTVRATLRRIRHKLHDCISRKTALANDSALAEFGEF